MTGDRPVCVTVIGWGTIAVATLAIASGAMGGMASIMMGPAPQRGGAPDPMDFVFQHFAVLALLQAALGILLIFAGRSLLLLRRWAARVVEAVAWLLLGYAVCFSLFFVHQMYAVSGVDPRPMPITFVLFMGLAATFSLAFWCVPLVLTISNLRSKRVQDGLV